MKNGKRAHGPLYRRSAFSIEGTNPDRSDKDNESRTNAEVSKELPILSRHYPISVEQEIAMTRKLDEVLAKGIDTRKIDLSDYPNPVGLERHVVINRIIEHYGLSPFLTVFDRLRIEMAIGLNGLN